MIPFLDINQAQCTILPEIEAAVLQVVRRGWYLLGEEIEGFESELTQWLGGGKAAGCSNGLDAIRLILRAYIHMGHLAPGDVVLLPAGSFIATALAVTDCGLKPQLVEAKASTLNMDFAALEAQIGERCKAVIVVHLYGLCNWSDETISALRSRGLIIIEDNAQAIGAQHNGCSTGLLGDAAAFSFYPTKNIGAAGDAGAVVSSDGELIEVIKAIRNYGSTQKYSHQIVGLNCRMDEIQAAILRVKLRHAATDLLHRRSLVKQYIQGITHKDILVPFTNAEHSGMVWHLFPVLTHHRNALQLHLSSQGIGTQVHYPIPIHKQECFKGMSHLSFPVTEMIANCELSLPLSTGHTPQQIEQVIHSINSFHP